MKLVLRGVKFFVLGVLLFTACENPIEINNQEDDGLYLIKQGNHSSGISINGFDGNHLVFEAKFDESAIYETRNPENQADINKLLGFSDCETFHHVNSARFGWRWYNDRLEIMAYVYDDGKRTFKYITTIPFDKFFTYEIRKEQDGYLFKVGNDAVVKVETSGTCLGTSNELLWPYFGGDEKAPHDISIYIRHMRQDSEAQFSI